MEPKSLRAPLWIAGVAAMLFGTAAMTNVPVAGWLRNSSEGFDGTSAPDRLPAASASTRALTSSGEDQVRGKPRCGECGFVESTRRIEPEGNSPAIYEITVRLANGSTHVLSDASPANWRPGERIILMGGESASVR